MAKLGVISEPSALAYEEYIQRLQTEYPHSVLKLPNHRGFALAVREGLLRCSTEYALVVQHDRSVCHTVDCMEQLLGAMDAEHSVRYIGFSTFKSAQHDRVLHERYGLLETLAPAMLQVDITAVLLPLLFWYDSTHLAHVKMYLEIYKPFTHAPVEVRDHFGARGMKDMLLRKGDFIEDRFGQAQRNMIARLQEKGLPEAALSLSKWFGSYLLWPATVPTAR
jgi:diketogulonate reductase-like aldo/keto reductase